jgi:hypothetical protein
MTRAFERADARLLHLPVLEALLARREAGVPEIDDPELVDLVIAELLAGRSADGSWYGSLTRTAELLHDIRDLHEAVPAGDAQVAAAGDAQVAAAGDAQVVAAGGAQGVPMEAARAVRPSVRFLLRRQNGPGRFGGGCTPALHQVGLCVHAVSGFFAAAPEAVDLSTLTLQHGARFTSDTDARIGASCLALAAVLRWGESNGEMGLHLDALRRLVLLEDRDRARLVSSAGLGCTALALFAAPASDPARAVLPDVVRALTRAQRGDGSWADIDMFFVLSVLTRLMEDPQCAPLLEAPLQRAGQLLAVLQQPDGDWGRQSGPWRLLTGWRVLRLATTAAQRGATPARGRR